MWYYDKPQKGRLQAMTSFVTSCYDHPVLKQCLSVSMNEELQVWAAPLADGGIVVLLLNRLEVAQKITAHWGDVGLNETVTKTVRDILKRADQGAMAGALTASVPGHGCRLFKLS
jgi:alpha-galactosidase